MAQKKKASALTTDRLVRLYQLLQLLENGPLSRDTLLRKLKLDLRGFYRDLEKLRLFGIRLDMKDGIYSLRAAFVETANKLPFPAYPMTLAEAITLSEGRSLAHKKLKKHVDKLLGKRRSSR